MVKLLVMLRSDAESPGLVQHDFTRLGVAQPDQGTPTGSTPLSALTEPSPPC